LRDEGVDSRGGPSGGGGGAIAEIGVEPAAREGEDGGIGDRAVAGRIEKAVGDDGRPGE
jgi:hypothetical protein